MTVDATHNTQPAQRRQRSTTMITKQGTLYPVGSYSDHYTGPIHITSRGLQFVVDGDQLDALFADDAQPDGMVYEGADSNRFPDGTALAFRYKMLDRPGLPLLMNENAWRLFAREIGPMLRVELAPVPLEAPAAPADDVTAAG